MMTNMSTYIKKYVSVTSLIWLLWKRHMQRLQKGYDRGLIVEIAIYIYRIFTKLWLGRASTKVSMRTI